MAVSQSHLNFLQFPLVSTLFECSSPALLFSDLPNSSTVRSSSLTCHPSSFRRRNGFIFLPITVRFSHRGRCFTKSSNENWAKGDDISSGWKDNDDDNDNKVEQSNNGSNKNSADDGIVNHQEVSVLGTQHSDSQLLSTSTDSLSLGIKEPVYEVILISFGF